MVEFFHLNPRFFPVSTRDHLPLEAILKFGALPLGTKRGLWPFRGLAPRLNVGFVNPQNRAAIREIKRLTAQRKDVSGVQMFRLDPTEFLEIVIAAYGVNRESLTGLPAASLEPALRDCLETEASTIVTP